jgi:diaminopimelate epimerase
MRIHFYKYQGTGNDFVIIDNRELECNTLTQRQVAFLCHRRFGIGADGLMLLNSQTGYDFEMKYYNSDGRESTMCGNGGRCLVKFAGDKGLIRSTYKFKAIDGDHEATVTNEGDIALKMNDVQNVRTWHGDYILNTGSPHLVHLVNNVMALDVYDKGRAIRFSDEFKQQGINVNFVEQTDEPDKIIVRTYERGVEDETLSCGTGVTAAALVCPHNDNGFNRVEVTTKGGKLSVEYDKTDSVFENIWLVGPAQRVFEGFIEI